MILNMKAFTLFLIVAIGFSIFSEDPKTISVTTVVQRSSGDPIRLKSREFIPTPGIDTAFTLVARSPRHGLIQLNRIPTLSERDTLRRAGVELLTYIPDRTFLARLPASVRPVLGFSIVRYLGPLRPTDKVEARILQQGVNPFSRNSDGTIRLTVLFFKDVAIREAAAVVVARGGLIIETLADFHMIRADFPEQSLRDLIAEDAVEWVEDVFEDKILSDGARAAMRVDLLHAAPYGLDGTGSIIGEWDGGHAITPANVVQHQDLVGRVTRGDTTTGMWDFHATTVAGMAIGSGQLSLSQSGTPFQWKGVAPNAKLIAYDWVSQFPEHSGAISTHNIDISTHSYMAGGNGVYNSQSISSDEIITGLYIKRIPIFWAAGNQRDGTNTHYCDIDLDGNKSTKYDAYDCIVNYASAKNTISVGATYTNDDSMTYFSSWGPTDDGRLKPEIVAPGHGPWPHIKTTSNTPIDTYASTLGTSISTPAAAGSAAVMLQRFRQLCPSNGTPLPSTVKSLLIHGAYDLDDSTAWYNRGPDFASGYGRLDLQRSVDLIPFHVEDTVPHLGVKNYPIVVVAQQDLKVTLVWDDPPASAIASVALINNLDLELVDPSGGTHKPWILDPTNPNFPATRGVDNRNVVEQVVVDNVGFALAGTWTIRVKGTNVPSLNQKFSLVSELLQATSCTGLAPVADLWGADTPNDDGTETNPDTGPMWISDDIRVRLAPADGPHENPEFGQTNYAYITVRNRGTQTGPYARVFLYWANASTGLSWPTDWNQIGTATAVNVPSNSSTVVGPIPWNPIGTGHYCLYARMITHNEPITSESADVNANTNQSNQIIWKNVTVVNNLLLVDQPVYPFIVRNPRFNTAIFNLVFEEPREQLRDPFLNRVQIFVDLGKPLYERWKRSRGRQRGLSPAGGTVFRVVDPRRAEILGFSMRAREEFTVRIRFSSRELPRGASYRFDVIQKPATGRQSKGGVSYRLQAELPKRP